MSRFQKFSRVLFILLLPALLLSGCASDSGDSDSDSGSDTMTIAGTVVDRNSTPLSGVFVSAYGIEGTTDSSGNFALSGVSAPSDRVVINFQKDGYFDAVIGERPASTTSVNVRVAMLKKELAGKFDNSSGGDVSGDSMDATFDTDSFVNADGSSASGEVSIYSSYVDPDSSDFGSAMPGGDFSATSGGDDGVLTSYGAVAMAAEDASGTEVRLSKNADICMDIPSSLRADAPDSMPVWTMNALSGIWTQAATAVREGDKYCFFLTEMGKINCDLFNRSAIVKGKVCSAPDTGAPNAKVDIGQNTIYTADDGSYSAIVPSEKTFTISTSYGDESVGPFNAASSNEVDINCEEEEEEDPGGGGDYGGSGSYCAYNYPEDACDIVCDAYNSSTYISCRFAAGTGDAPCGAMTYDNKYDYGYDGSYDGGRVGACILTFSY
jgi:hypothetical protein